MARDVIGDKLRELEALDRLGLLHPARPQRGLLAPPDAVPNTPLASGPNMEAERQNLKTLAGVIDSKPNIADAVPGPQPVKGLLASSTPSPSGGLLGAMSGSPAPSFGGNTREAGRGRPSLWSALDDVLFGGAAGERASERRQRDRAEDQQAAHREAYAAATQGGAFDPNRYSARMAELGQAPDLDGVARLEGVTDSQDVRGFRNRTERRNVTAGALAPVAGLPADERPDALQGVAAYLAREGYSFDPNTPEPVVGSMIGGAMGADAVFDNQRGDRAQAEAIRSNMSNEGFRDRDLNVRQQASERDYNYRRQRDQAEDGFRERSLDIQEKGLNANSTTEIAAAIQSKAITMGVASLTPEERAIYDRSIAPPSAGGIFGLLGGGASAPAAPAAPSGPRRASGASRDQAVTVGSQADFDALPAGAWFVNPADGRVMQKAR